ncbi:hypothetical protein WMW72_35065 [Paenibacillus filicis]|uniref:Zinc-finger domain-containing protein n=1 Tax=Paenibacillus filicis TaxID=669464 RepID=A0ABU9DWA9_9BACL
MTHMPENVWRLYTEDRLGPDDRERCDHHLLTCDACLDVYLRCVEQMSESLPVPDMDVFAETAMLHWAEQTAQASISSSKEAKGCSDKRRSWMRHPVFHYTVAAAITLILMGSGVFQIFTQQASAWDANASDWMKQHPPSWSEQLMEQTVGLIAALQPKPKQEERRGKRDE